MQVEIEVKVNGALVKRLVETVDGTLEEMEETVDALSRKVASQTLQASVDAVEVPQPNMMKLSPDSKRLYVTNSILSSLDGDVRFGAWLFHVGPEGMERDESFDPDFNGFDTGPAGPHDMLLK